MDKETEILILTSQIKALKDLPYESIWTGSEKSYRQRSVVSMENLLKAIAEKGQALRQLQNEEL